MMSGNVFSESATGQDLHSKLNKIMKDQGFWKGQKFEQETFSPSAWNA